MPLYVDKFKIDTDEILIKDSEASQIVNNIFSPVEQGKNILFIGDSWTVGSGRSEERR